VFNQFCDTWECHNITDHKLRNDPRGEGGGFWRVCRGAATGKSWFIIREGQEVFPSPNVCAVSGARLVFCLVDTESPLPCGRAARAWGWPHTPANRLKNESNSKYLPPPHPIRLHGLHRKRFLVPVLCRITSTIFTYSSMQARTSYLTPQVCMFIDFTSYATVFVMFDFMTRFSLTINSPAQAESFSHYSCVNIWKKSMLHLANSRLRSDRCHASDKAARNIVWRRVFTFGANLKLHIC